MSATKTMKRASLVCIGAAVCALAACSPDMTAQDDLVKGDIINGSAVSGSGPPYNPGTVAVYHQFSRPCSGTLIASRWVLTALHCVNIDANDLNSPLMVPSQISVVRAVSPGLQPPAGAIQATKLIRHPSQDFALVRLSADIAYPVGFWDGDGPELVNTFVKAMGFGRSFYTFPGDDPTNDIENGMSGAGTLRTANIKITGVEFAPGHLLPQPEFFDLIDNSSGQITWHGDSGGPDYVLVDKLGRQATGIAGVHQTSSGINTAGDGAVPQVRAFLKTQMFNGGDVDGDHRADFIVTGVSGWQSIPVGQSNGDGTFTFQNPPVASFPGLAAGQSVQTVVGDFDGDGTTDVALTGPSGWQSIPIAFGNGAGSGSFAFRFSNVTNGAGSFPQLASVGGGTRAVGGDFDGDGRTDIALTGGGTQTTVPVAFSNGDGTFTVKNVTNGAGPNFPIWAQTVGVHPIAGDFDGDGRTDIALTGASGWGSLPVAFSNGDGSFFVQNLATANFPSWASASGVKFASGDFNGDGRDDIVAVGPPSWGNIRFAVSNGDGSFGGAAVNVNANFPIWASNTHATPLAIDVNGDGQSDLALVGGTGWGSVPVLMNLGNGVFQDPPVNAPAATLASLAANTNARSLGGH